MNRFLNCDRLEESRNNCENENNLRDEWIRSKADELAKSFPDDVINFYNHWLNILPSQVGLDTDFAQDAYAKFVDEVCTAKASELSKESDWLRDNYLSIDEVA